MTDRNELTLVLQGGWTAEAEISRASGAACLAAANAAGWNAQALEVTRTLPAELAQLKPQRIFNALHGQMGEDGTIQGLLNLMDIPYTHSGLLASAIAMDKPATKHALAHCGIAFPEAIPFTIEGECITLKHGVTQPVVVKPRNDGSSIGVVIAEDASAIPPLSFWPQKTQLMVEAYIPGRELTVAVLHGEPLTVTEISQTRPFYDYHAKYSTGGSTHRLPADIPPDISARCMEWARLAHHALGCRGVSRADYRWNEATGALFMLEINTQPGMTATSLVPEQAQAHGIAMPELISQLLEAAQCD